MSELTRADIERLRSLYTDDVEVFGRWDKTTIDAVFAALPALLDLTQDGLRFRRLIAQIDSAELVGPDERSAGLEWVLYRIDDLIDTGTAQDSAEQEGERDE